MTTNNEQYFWTDKRVRTSLWTIASLGIVASAIVSVATITNHASLVKGLRQTLWRDGIDQRLGSAFSAINDFPGSAGKDLLFLETLSNEKDLRNFIAKNEAYRELYVFEQGGSCAMKIRKIDGETTVCGEISSDFTHVMEKTKPLSSSEIYISSPTLYEGAPVLFYATHANTGNIFISVIDADYFLEEVRRLSRAGEAVYLLDNSGFYLAHPDRAKEVFSGATDTFYHDFPMIPGNALADATLRRFETDHAVFTFWRIYPTESNFALYEGSNKIFGTGHDNQYFWVMAAVSDKPNAESWWRNSSYLVSTLIVFLAHLAVIVLLYFIIFHPEKIRLPGK